MQGDPFAANSFILAIEALGNFLKRAREVGFISSLRVGGRVVKDWSDPSFVDDTLIFCDACEEQMMYLSWILV